MKTFTPKPKDLTHNWYIVDASGVVLGRLASAVADVLRGKTKPTYAPNADLGDFVIIINADKVAVTGRKETQKLIWHDYSGFPSGLHSETVGELRAKNPERLVRTAVRGMMPKNRLSRVQLNRLRIFAGSDYPYQAQKPTKLDIASRKVAQGK